MAEPRRIYAKLRFEWDAPLIVSRSEQTHFLVEQIARRLPDEWPGLSVTLVAEGEVDDA